IMDITVAIDKLEKIGIEAVNDELRAKGIADEAVTALAPILSLSGSNREKLASLRETIGGSETGVRGIEEMETIFGLTDAIGTDLDIELDLSLARGLNTHGAISEVKAKDYARKHLRRRTLRRPDGHLRHATTSGVGISFGATASTT
ncbi:MAG: histidine--tRNA ligase, partial [Alistipes onderdonkii]